MEHLLISPKVPQTAKDGNNCHVTQGNRMNAIVVNPPK
jgi:hypothetical protein